ncbi:MAG: DUF1189 domain-containing protein [Planctomycetota bacterium]|jgi:hypothetical protein
MKRYRIFHIPALAFFSKDLYTDVALNWKGTCLGYLFLLLLVCWIPAMIQLNSGLDNFVETEAPKLTSQVPTITIKDGIVSTDVPQPHYIYVPDIDNVVLAAIDTTGQFTSLNDIDASVLLTADKIMYRQGEFETKTFDLSQVKEFTLDEDKLTNWLNILKKLVAPVLYPAALVGSYLFRIIQVLVCAAIGMLFVSSLNAQLSYISLVRLATVAITPAIIVKTILGAADIRLPAGWLLYMIVTLAYLYFGVKACSQPQYEQTPPEEDDGGPQYQSWRGG